MINFQVQSSASIQTLTHKFVISCAVIGYMRSYEIRVSPIIWMKISYDSKLDDQMKNKINLIELLIKLKWRVASSPSVYT